MNKNKTGSILSLNWGFPGWPLGTLCALWWKAVVLRLYVYWVDRRGWEA